MKRDQEGPGARQALRFGSVTIAFSVRRADRERFRVAVHPDLRVVVDAPTGKSSEEIAHRVRGKAGWIIRQLDYFAQFIPRQPARRYVSGETCYYLGRQYRLKVVEEAPCKVSLHGRYLWVQTVAKEDPSRIRTQVLEWYQQRAKHIFTQRIDKWEEALRRHGIARPTLSTRRMKRRWGSCSRPGMILLNTDLVKAPVHCIDYVIVHEQCHLRHPNHSKAFFGLLAAILPDWEKRKARLEESTTI